MKQTEHYHLSQWDGTDRILREDFNRDNKTIDAALADLKQSVGDNLSGTLETLNSAISGKLGKMEIIKSCPSDGEPFHTGTGFYLANLINWNDWEYICVLVQFPGAKPDDSAAARLAYHPPGGDMVDIAPLAMPGFLAVFLPRHDENANVAGFIISDRFIPFSFGFPYKRFSGLNFGMNRGSSTTPNIFYFGGK